MEISDGGTKEVFQVSKRTPTCDQNENVSTIVATSGNNLIMTYNRGELFSLRDHLVERNSVCTLDYKSLYIWYLLFIIKIDFYYR